MNTFFEELKAEYEKIMQETPTIPNICGNCNYAILGDNVTWDCPPTFYGCLLGKDESIHHNGFASELDCFAWEKQTEELKKQKEKKLSEIIEDRTRKYELEELARLKAKYE